MDFKVKRSLWRCGGFGPYKMGFGYISLHNRDNYMCCLGHVALQLGNKVDDIHNQAKLYTTNVGFDVVNVLQVKAIEINDDDSISNTECERRLDDLFAAHGHTLTFED